MSDHLLTDRISDNLTRLKLPRMREIFSEQQQQAESNSQSYLSFLDLLLEEEVAQKEQRRIETALKISGLPFIKTIDDFEPGRGHSVPDGNLLAGDAGPFHRDDPRRRSPYLQGDAAPEADERLLRPGGDRPDGPHRLRLPPRLGRPRVVSVFSGGRRGQLRHDPPRNLGIFHPPDDRDV